jgi:hypothetical protein
MLRAQARLPLDAPDLNVPEVEAGKAAYEDLGEAIDELADGAVGNLDDAFGGLIGTARNTVKGIKGLSSSVLSLATKVKGPLAALLLYAGSVNKISSASKDVSSALKILDIRLLRTGNIAGATREEIIDLADGMESLYGLNSNDFIRGFERLGRFENIAVPLETVAKAAADLAAVRDIPITDAIQDFGEILNDPIRNMNRLRDLGIQFSDEFVDNVKTAFEETGDSIAAQTAIIDEFNAVIGGAALGNIDDFGGAISNLGVAWDGLFADEDIAKRWKEEITEPIYGTINDLAEFLRSDEVVAGFKAFAGVVIDVTSVVVDFGVALVNFPVDVIDSVVGAINSLRGIESEAIVPANLGEALDEARRLNAEYDDMRALRSVIFDMSNSASPSFYKANDDLVEIGKLRTAALATFQEFATNKVDEVISTKGIKDNEDALEFFNELLVETLEYVEQQRDLGVSTESAEASVRFLYGLIDTLDAAMPDAKERSGERGDRAGSETGLGTSTDRETRTTPKEVIADLEKEIALTSELSDVRREFLELGEEFTDAEKASSEERITALIAERDANQQYLDGIKAAEALIEATSAATRTQAEAQAGLSEEQSQYNRLLEEYPDIPETLREQLRETLALAQATREQTEALKEQEEVFKDVAKGLEATLTPLEKQAQEIDNLVEKWNSLSAQRQEELGGEEALREALRRMGKDYDELAEKGKETWLDLDAVAEQAARAMHSNFSSLFFDLMQGDFDDLGDRFKQTIDRMVSDLLASKLLESIAPKDGSGGIGGPLGAFIGAFTGGGQEDEALSEGNPATAAIESIGQATSNSTAQVVQESQAGTQAVVSAVDVGTSTGFQQGQSIGSISDPISLGAGTIAGLRAPIMISSLSINQLAQAIGAEMAAVAASGAGAGGGGGGSNLLGTVSSFLPFPYNLLGSFGGSGGGTEGGSSSGGGGTGGPAGFEKGGFVRPSELVEVNEKGEEIVRVGGMDILLPSPTTKIQMNTPLPLKGFASGAGEQLIIGSGEDKGSFGTLKSLIKSQQKSTAQPQVFHLGSRTFMKMGTQAGFVIPHEKTKELVQKQVMAGASVGSVPGREFGGAVQSRSVYEVNEGVMPELLTIGSRDFLLTGGTSGMVTPMESASQLGTNQSVNITIVTPDVDGFRKTQDQIQNEMGRAASLANRRNG